MTARTALVLVGLSITAVVVVLLTGCTTPETDAEMRYLNAVYEVAKEEGLDWTNKTEEAVLNFGTVTCGNLADGLHEDVIRAASMTGDPSADRVADTAVSAAIEHLCWE